MEKLLLPTRLHDPLLLKTLQVGTTVSLGLISGIAFGLFGWVIPIIRQSTTDRSKINQFIHTITLGGRYLQTTGRTQAVIILTLALLLRQHPDPSIAKRWKIYATALAALVPVAPFEIISIFPTNDRITELGHQLEKGVDNFEDERSAELDRLLVSWQKWHTGRIMIPLTAGVVTALGLLY